MRKQLIPQAGEVRGILSLDRLLGRLRHAATLIACGAYFLSMIVYTLWAQQGTIFFLLLLNALCWGMAAISLRRWQKMEIQDLPLTTDAAKYLAYVRRAWRFYRTPSFYIAWMLLGLWLWKGTAFARSARASLMVSVMVFYAARWVLLNRLNALHVRVCAASEADKGYHYDHKKELRSALLAFLLYWGPVLSLYALASFLFHSWLMFLFLPLLAAILYLLFFLICNPFSRYAAVRRRRTGVKLWQAAALLVVFGCISALLTTGVLTFGYEISNFTPVERAELAISYNAEEGVYTLVRPENREMRILQLTDLHLACGLFTLEQDHLAINACESLIRAAQPDLVIVTGDLSYPIGVQTLSHDNYLPISAFAMAMEKLQVPWIFVYGNHDTEKYAVYDAQEINARLCRNYAMRAPGDGRWLLMAEVQPDIDGRYNQLLLIENAQGEPERLLYLLDTHAYAQGGYDCVHENQAQWYLQTTAALPVPSFVFLHIPPRAYTHAAEALQSGEAEYLFGTNDESPCYPSQADHLFTALTQTGLTQAVFCGHDHINTLGVRYAGIDWVYGLSIDYLAYPGIMERTAQRGATLICCEGAHYTITPLPLDALSDNEANERKEALHARGKTHYWLAGAR